MGNVSTDWTMTSVAHILICYEKGFCEKVLKARTKLYFFACAQRLETKMKTQSLPFTRGGSVPLLTDIVFFMRYGMS